MKTFYQLLANTISASITNYTVWFAITYFVYLQTKSVFATAIISGLFLVATAASGIWFGSLVDNHRKKNIMLLSSAISLVMYIITFAIYQLAPAEEFKNISSVILWVFVVLIMVGVMIGNIRNIALTTLVTILVPEDRRDKANGLVGTASGIAFLVVSVISGFLVAWGGMFYVLVLAIGMTVITLVHLWFLPIEEKKIVHAEGTSPNIDLKGTFKIVAAIPGLIALILFTTFNNFLGGVFMSLMDAYGLSLVSVEVWGLIWGGLSLGFIVGGAFIAKFGLGKNPVKTLFLANVIIWTITIFFTIQPSIILLSIGMFVYLTVAPFIEASEQTIIQKVVPPERQGRVFGFAQSIEQSASPLTAFAIGPLTQFVFIPFMTDGAGAQLIGSWFGTGPARGIALVFTIAGILGLITTLIAMRSKSAKWLAQRYLDTKSSVMPDEEIQNASIS